MPKQVFNPLSGNFDLVPTDSEIQSAAVEDTIVDGVTDIAPSQNAVFDALALKVDTSEVGAANGVASLDSGGKVPTSQLPNSVMDYLGTWAASTNTPTLTDGIGNAGDVYVASDSGTVNFGAGPITFAAGDWVIYSGTVWEKSINSNAVASVNGFTGAVVLTTTDIAEGSNLYFTNARAQGAITGGASSIVTSNLSANLALVSDGSGKVAVSAVTSTELGYLSGVTSAIQTQFGNKANVTLDNLTTTAINANLIFNKSLPILQSGDTTAAASANLTVQSGNTTVGVFNSGTLTLSTGTSAASSSGDLSIATGTSSAATGNLNISTGAKSGAQTGNSGSVTIASGAYGSSSNSASGDVLLKSGDKTSGTNGATGDLTLRSGNTSSTSGSTPTGNVLLNSGDSTGASTIPTGSVTIRSGNKSSTGSAASGAVSMRSGTAQVGATGTANFGSGVATANTSGNVTLSSGTGTTGTGTITVASGNASANVSGTVTVSSGTGTTGTGAVTVSSGNASAGNSGAVTVSSGTASGTRGDVVLDGNEINASARKIANVKTQGFNAQSADPTSPTTGQIQYADGTVRVAGFWVWDGSAWQPVGSNAGFIGSDWTSYTPTYTGLGTVTPSDVVYRRVGGSVQIRGRFTVGTATAVEARVSLPTGLTTPSGVPALSHVGTYTNNNTSSNSHGGFILMEPSLGYFTFSVPQVFGSNSNTPLSKAQGSGTSGVGETAGAIISVFCELPIDGWAANGIAPVSGGYRSATTTDTATTNDFNGVINFSGASFTCTIPTAVGNQGKTMTFVHNGTSLTQTYTIATVSSQTIYGGTVSGTTYLLYTSGERLKIVSDGTNWLIQDHNATTAWAAYTPTFGAGFGTVSTSEFFWRRKGDSISIRGSWTNGTVAASAATISLPSGVTTATTSLRKIVGTGGQQVNNSQILSVIVNSAATVLSMSVFATTSTDPTTQQNGNTVSGTGNIVFLTAMDIQVTGWNP